MIIQLALLSFVARPILNYYQYAMDKTGAIKVTAAVIIEEGRVLITQRPPDGRHPGAWEFPGGKIETGETPQECLARELTEELGIVAAVGEKLAGVRHAYHDLEVELLAFKCHISSGRPQNIACSDHAWVVLGDLDGYDLLPPDKGVAERLIQQG